MAKMFWLPHKRITYFCREILEHTREILELPS